MSKMSAHPKYLIYHDLIGFSAKVRPKSKTKEENYTDIGHIINETHNMVISQKENHVKKYIKQDHIFRFTLTPKKGGPEIEMEVDGTKIVGHPINRLRSLRKKRW